MDVLHPFQRLARKPGAIEIFDVAVLSIEQVQDLEADAPAPVELVADAGVHEESGIGTHTAVLDERPRSEIADADPAEPTLNNIIHGRACGDHGLDGARDVIARGIVILEAGPGEREVRVQHEPRPGPAIIGPFDTEALARTAGLGGAGIADEEQLGVEIEQAERQRALEMGDDQGAPVILKALYNAFEAVRR